MAIYHLEAKVVSRGTGRSAVAASAYMSCSKLYNDYDGVQHDYTRKQGLVWQQTFLPPMTPAEWQDRNILWNAVEEAEKTKDSRLARELVVALPKELNKDGWTALLTEFVQDHFVADGMCADVAVHDTDGHNPHAHILLTVRPLNEDGTWQYKTEKEYLCVKDGEERGFTAAEFKVAQTEGWEKQYPYKVGKKKIYMPPSEAEMRGYERADKHPKSTRYGRQNPISERWNSEEQLVLWRAAWADVSNCYLERAGSDERIDHRSHVARGLDEQPTIHEGVFARMMEREGKTSDRCELNRQIRADNKLLRELKSQVKKLTDAIKSTVPAIAGAMERLRRNMLIFKYQALYARDSRQATKKSLSAVKPDFDRYTRITGKLKAKVKERKELLAEKKALPAWQVMKSRELSRRITELTEDMEELKSEKVAFLLAFDKSDDAGMKEIREWITSMETSLQKAEQADKQYSGELNAALAEHKELTEQAAELDADELNAARQELRPNMERDAMQRLQSGYMDKYKPEIMERSKRDVAGLLGEVLPEQKSIHEQLCQSKPQTEQPRRKDKSKEQER
jgi:predicted nucleic acid-binding Zn ribbon protein